MPWTMTCPAADRIRSTGLPVWAGLRHDQGIVYARVPRLQNCPANLAARVYSIASPAGRAQFLNVVLCTALTDEMFHSPKSRPWRNRFKGIQGARHKGDRGDYRFPRAARRTDRK